MKTFRLQLSGQVQGIGFRPHIYKLARQYGLMGWVSNKVDGVQILVSGEQEKISDFWNKLRSEPPSSAIISQTSSSSLPYQEFNAFRILDSQCNGNPNIMITPDLGLCTVCRQEIWKLRNRRYQYAFNTCVRCGPRYSIIQGLPYDRPVTAMKSFDQCERCVSEYTNPANRRFHAQTNSCPDCPIELSWLDRNGRLLSDHQAGTIDAAVAALQEGHIIAVKGIGGFLLLADATSSQAIQTLRTRKQRPTKPFALLYPNVEALQRDVYATPQELSAWQSMESPIVLFRLRPDKRKGIAREQIAPHQQRLGIMQPYTPLLELLAVHFGKPLIATSANISGATIVYQNREAIRELSQVADYFLTNNRDIVTPQDDSVIAFTETKQKIVFRRSRGLAPTVVDLDLECAIGNVLAMGGLLKSTISIQLHKHTYLSQYLGNTESYDNLVTYKKVLRHLMNILHFQPDLIVVDRHPDYPTAKLGFELAKKYAVPLVQIQHHQAHFAAVLAENRLLDCDHPILGVIWDGTGYGDDGNIWGGEFFIYQDRKISRFDHFEYYDHLFGDKMAREPRISALSLTTQLPEARNYVSKKFTSAEWKVYQKILATNGHIKTSSVGRLFDAAASLLDITDKQSFEGEAAMRMQAIAEKCVHNGCMSIQPYRVSSPSPRQIIRAMVLDKIRGTRKEEIALKFHLTLSKIIRSMAEKCGIDSIAFSGGVFQNTLLVDLISAELANDFTTFFHKQLSPNDENISFGQVAAVMMSAEDPKSMRSGGLHQKVK